MNFAADICLLKMVARFFLHPKRQFFPSENKRHSFYLKFITKIPGDTLLTNSAELPFTEQIFIETSCLVPLVFATTEGRSAHWPPSSEHIHSVRFVR